MRVHTWLCCTGEVWREDLLFHHKTKQHRSSLTRAQDTQESDRDWLYYLVHWHKYSSLQRFLPELWVGRPLSKPVIHRATITVYLCVSPHQFLWSTCQCHQTTTGWWCHTLAGSPEERETHRDIQTKSNNESHSVNTGWVVVSWGSFPLKLLLVYTVNTKHALFDKGGDFNHSVVASCSFSHLSPAGIRAKDGAEPPLSWGVPKERKKR